MTLVLLNHMIALSPLRRVFNWFHLCLVYSTWQLCIGEMNWWNEFKKFLSTIFFKHAYYIDTGRYNEYCISKM